LMVERPSPDVHANLLRPFPTVSAKLLLRNRRNSKPSWSFVISGR